MRGTGVTLARLLLDPPAYLDTDICRSAAEAVEGIREALQSPSPYGELGSRLSAVVPDDSDERSTEQDERDAWVSGDNEALRPLADRIIRHCHAITSQPHVGPAVKLLQVRNILALDLAHHAISSSWNATDTPARHRFFLASYTPEERRNNIRVFSETTYRTARLKLTQAIVAHLAQTMRDIANSRPPADWADYFEPRSNLQTVATTLNRAGVGADFAFEAERAYELASGGGYGRPSDAFRVLLESVDLLVGTGQYRYLRIGPELLASMVGAVWPHMPASADDFLMLVFREWHIVVGEAEAVGTDLANQVEGAELRNARFLEDMMVNAGLALSLFRSDVHGWPASSRGHVMSTRVALALVDLIRADLTVDEPAWMLVEGIDVASLRTSVESGQTTAFHC